MSCRKNIRKPFIIITAGGTGGHVFPAVSVAKELLKKHNILFATDKRGRKYLKKFQEYTTITQPILTKVRLLLYISVAFNLLRALCFLLKNRPICVIGFGGYPSVSFVLAAQMLRIKTIIHEQNVVIGKANKLLSKFANEVILSFGTEGKVIGTPTRFEHLYDNFQYKPSPSPGFTLLVLGGSQGSSIITKKITEGLCSISKAVRDNIFVYHQARIEDIDRITKIYQKYRIRSQVQPFFDNMDEIYTKTDLVLARSGASTIFEVIGFKLPSILIPFKNSINKDQEANATYMQKNGASIVFHEDDKTDSITEKIMELYENRKILQSMSHNASKLYVDNITERVVETITYQIQKA
ncbi:MAG: UDP-N-acetylglucosamine--N-acetylmuramyl-(pentapeptide) pyrophosphoryl-undecaprenol N-acetylglucosamine transferase [Holosporales bacterium]|jgi:UDP-N-acetylglucosamine--N-acetylmuramyl-(pentapeptide) pyrophosphoryl-undecaprenol N-acetylglucosamine transferase|nr:UDP-N-acetylglucosamine--N-acetylmuramyl-(pentapeptide) pyrophosphoryl-undecaprenol N-acetylglucosamine transferase [Holosporales bacterium]